MNNPKSMMLGWGCLTLAAGVAYVYARKDINERRRNQEVAGARPAEKLDWQARIERDGLRATNPNSVSPNPDVSKTS